MKKNSISLKISAVIASALLFLTLFFISCNNEKRESPTEGELTLISSEDVYPIMALEVQDFQRIYDKTKITHLSSSTRDAIVQLLNDSVKVIVSGRDFNNEEKQVIEKNGLEVSATKIAYDAVVVISNKNNGITKMTTTELADIFSGKKKLWSKFSDSKLSNEIFLAIGDINSGVHEFVAQKILGGKKIDAVVYPCSTTSQVIEMVKQHPNALGFITSSWLTDAVNLVNVVELGDPQFRRDSTQKEMEYFSPHQAHVYRNYYPLTRTIYILSHNVGKGVGLGFTSFVAGVEGQKIIVKNGLVPATMPVRLVQLTQQ